MIDALYKRLAIPDACYLDKRVFKTLFHEHVVLGITDKKAFREDIDTITWQYTLKPSTIPVQPYTDDQREYLEIAILQVDLKTLKRTGRIVEVIHRAIPYPVVIVLALEATCALSLAHKRFSQAEKGAIVAEEFVTTDWIDLVAATPIQTAFLDSLAVSGLPHTHFFALYSALVDRVTALECARLTGQYRLESAAERRETRRQRLAACHELEVLIAEHKAAIKAETQFSHQVELNMKVKDLQSRLQERTTML
ncbi:MAG: DUF4391 domain-containing protein [Planctomycetota bacterium]|nr:DUF4391 domain-containing protein [Planctomycetota bacterium]